MTIVISVPDLADTCKPAGTIAATSNQGFLDTVVGQHTKLHYTSRRELYIAQSLRPHWSDPDKTVDSGAFTNAAVSLGVQAMHQCFALHRPLGLRPEALWYMIVHQVAEFVRQNSDTYAHLFTDTPEAKQKIMVIDDSLRRDGEVNSSDWMHTISLFREAMGKKVSDKTIDLFLPQFSTTDQADETALLVSLMDAASPYYDYEVFTDCGIPEIRLEGEIIDWQRLYEQTVKMAQTFNGLKAYFDHLLPVLETIVETVSGRAIDPDFWNSIYKLDSGSGSEYVNGWINAFFAFYNTDEGQTLKPEYSYDWRECYTSVSHFPSHLSTVPFVWNYYGTEIPMTFTAGIMGVDYAAERYLTPRLGFAVVEN